MYAIIRDGSKQYRVEKGETVEVDRKAKKKEGEKIEFTDVLLLSDGKDIKIGTPVVEGVKVVGEVVKEVKDKKVRVFKYQRRLGYHKTIGHRQKYTLVKVTDIVTG